MIWVERRERILRKINPDLCNKASQLPPASGQLFGKTFIDNLKEHAQLSRAIAAVKRPPRDSSATAARGRSHCTQGGRTSGNMSFLGRHESAQYGGGKGARNQPYSHPQRAACGVRRAVCMRRHGLALVYQLRHALTV